MVEIIQETSCKSYAMNIVFNICTVISFFSCHNEDDQKVDVWSIGITILELCDGKLPHSHLNPMRAIFAISKSDAPKLSNSGRNGITLVRIIEYMNSRLNLYIPSC